MSYEYLQDLIKKPAVSFAGALDQASIMLWDPGAEKTTGVERDPLLEQWMTNAFLLTSLTTNPKRLVQSDRSAQDLVYALICHLLIEAMPGAGLIEAAHTLKQISKFYESLPSSEPTALPKLESISVEVLEPVVRPPRYFDEEE